MVVTLLLITDNDGIYFNLNCRDTRNYLKYNKYKKTLLYELFKNPY